jgi:SAM-dependent methyltransferase
MSLPPKLFDHQTLAKRRNRTDGTAWFIHDHAIDTIHERLSEVNRQFTKVAIVGSRAKEWSDAFGFSATCVMDHDTLDLEESSFDLIIHAMGLHWSNDPIGQLVQMQRALKPDGLMIAAFFGGQTLAELRIAFAQAEVSVMGGISPRVAPMGEIRDLGGLLQRAGLALPVADTLSLPVSYESPIRLMHDLRAMGETNIISARLKSFMPKRLLAEVIDQYHNNFADTDTRIKATFELVFLTGWAPSASQQKALAPGSAQVRLADALGTLEKNPEKD